MRCPECGEGLVINATFCDCGWKDTKRGGAVHNPSKCAFTTEGRRCRMVGTLSPFHGANIDYFCSWHDWVMNSNVRPDDKKKFMEWLQRWEGIRSHWNQQTPEETWRKVMAFETYTVSA